MNFSAFPRTVGNHMILSLPSHLPLTFDFKTLVLVVTNLWQCFKACRDQSNLLFNHISHVTSLICLLSIGNNFEDKI